MNEGKVFVGLYEESITPDKSVNLDGQFYERVSEGVESPLAATAMAVKVNDELGVFVSCDLMSIGQTMVDELKEKVNGYKGLDGRKVMIHATHTHTSVGYAGGCRQKTKVPGGLHVLKEFTKGMHLLEMPAEHAAEMGYQEGREFIISHLETAIKNAIDNLHPAYYQFGFGRASIGMNRRVCYDDGTTQMWGDTSFSNFKEMEDGADTGIEMAFVYDENKNLEAMVLNVACPAQIMEQRSVISSDYWGKLRVLLREKYGENLKLVATCAPAGDLCPRDLTRWVSPETPIKDPNVKRIDPQEHRADPSMFDVAGTWRAAKRIFNEVVDEYEILTENGLDGLKDTAVFVHEVEDLQLPYRKVTMKENLDAKKAVEDFVASAKSPDITFDDTARLHVYGGILARYINQQDIDIYPTEVHFGRFGDVAFTTTPFELFQNYGTRIRTHVRAVQSFQIQMTNGYYGYLPTEKAEQGGHYSAYVSSGNIGHEGGDLLVRSTIQKLNSYFPENARK